MPKFHPGKNLPWAHARAIRREERGSLVLMILVCLTLVSFALLFWLTVKPL